MHKLTVGTAVTLVRCGVPQPGTWKVFRLDRNTTYRLEDQETMTYVTAHESEVEVTV